MTTTTETRTCAASANLLAQADALLRAGAMRQASGKAWQAVEHRLYEIMRERDWDRSEVEECDEMGYLWRFGDILAKETDAPAEFIDMMVGAFSNYRESLQDGNPELFVRVGIGEARKFIAALERTAKPRGCGLKSLNLADIEMAATTQTRTLSTSADLLEQADALIRVGDKRLASGKAWQAVAHCLRTIADNRGWERAATGAHDEVGDLLEAASRLADESEDPEEIRGLYMSAGALYVNSIENWHTESMVRIGVRNARNLITSLERIAQPDTL